MTDRQGKGYGESSVEKHTSRASEESAASGKSKAAAGDVQKIREQTKSDINKTLRK
jgi:hypothetical protein